MTRLTWKSFNSGMIMGAVVGASLVGFGPRFFSAQIVQAAPSPQAPAAQPAPAAKGKGKQAVSTVPCGPNIQGDLGKNTAKDSRCFELPSTTELCACLPPLYARSTLCQVGDASLS